MESLASLLTVMLIAAATPGGAPGRTEPKELSMEREAGVQPDAGTHSGMPVESKRPTKSGATAVGISLWVFLVLAGSAILLGWLFSA